MANSISLDQFQNWMQAVILHSGNDDQALASPQAEKFIPEKIARNFILPSRNLTELERIGIYRRMYIYRLVEVLENDYTSVAHFLGDEKFYELVCDFLQAHPSRSYSLNPIGDNFPEFIRNNQQIKRRDFLYQLASLELAISKVFDVEQCPVLTKEMIATLTPEQWETARLKFSNAFQLLEFSYPVNEYFQSVLDNDHNHNTRKKSNYLAVFRQNYTVWRLPLERPAYLMLKALYQGKSLIDAIDETVNQLPKNNKKWQQQVFGWFQEWVSEGFFQAIE
jgi:hypothetical protein